MVDRLLDDLVRPGPPVDLVAGYTRLLPTTVITRILDIPGEDRERLWHWAEFGFATTERDPDDVTRAMKDFTAYTAQLVSTRRRDPGDDLLSTIVQATDREGDIPEHQLVHLLCGLLVAGQETSATALANAVFYLLTERPDAWRRIGADETAAALATERLLHSIPLGINPERPGSLLRTAEDVELGGVTIPAGDIVAADRTAASQDPHVFPPHSLSRLFTPLEAGTLAFGAGPHFCPGAWLARLQMQLALHRLAARLPNLHLTTPTTAITWRHGTSTRSPLHLPAAW